MEEAMKQDRHEKPSSPLISVRDEEDTTSAPVNAKQEPSLDPSPANMSPASVASSNNKPVGMDSVSRLSDSGSSTLTPRENMEEVDSTADKSKNEESASPPTSVGDEVVSSRAATTTDSPPNTKQVPSLKPPRPHLANKSHTSSSQKQEAATKEDSPSRDKVSGSFATVLPRKMEEDSTTRKNDHKPSSQLVSAGDEVESSPAPPIATDSSKITKDTHNSEPPPPTDMSPTTCASGNEKPETLQDSPSRLSVSGSIALARRDYMEEDSTADESENESLCRPVFVTGEVETSSTPVATGFSPVTKESSSLESPPPPPADKLSEKCSTVDESNDKPLSPPTSAGDKVEISPTPTTATDPPPATEDVASSEPSPPVNTTPTRGAGRHKKPDALQDSPSRRSVSGSFTLTPKSLRRNVSVENGFENVASIQRLVEYFVVLSCQPRWETSTNNANSNASPCPTNAKESQLTASERKQARVRRSPSRAALSSEQPTTKAGNEDKMNDDTETITNQTHSHRRNWSTIPGTELAIDAESSQAAAAQQASSPDTLPEEAVLPPPKPRGKWKRRQENQKTDGNIHMQDDEASLEEYTFQPKITARYPPSDYPDDPLNPMISHFCYPVGDVIVPTTQYMMPRVHHFVLTNDKGRKVYGTCLTVYEEYTPPEGAPGRPKERVHSSDDGDQSIEVSMGHEEAALYLPKCLCILSIWPYVKAFREYLAQLYRLSTSTNCMEAPIERYIMNLCTEIPAPPPGAFEVQISILDSVIRFWSPPAKLPIAYVSLPYRTLFDCLDVDNILHLWYCLTMERKVLLLSSQASILTVCSEIVCSLLYPMKWSHLYVPILPRFLCPMLDAPVPYLCGMTRDNWLHCQEFVSDETIVVDLDHNKVMFGERTPGLPSVPGKKWSKLSRSLHRVVGHFFWQTRGLEQEFSQFREQELDATAFKKIAREQGEDRWKEKLETFDNAFNLQFSPDSDNLDDSSQIEKEHSQWDEVQEAFLRFFVALLKDYRRFLNSPSSDNQADQEPDANDWLQWSSQRSFERNDFVASQKPEYLPYLSELCMTQHFDDFITKRLYSPEMPDIVFFDQSIDAKLNRSRLKIKKLKTPFLQSAKAHKVLKTFHAVEPNSSDLNSRAPFMYKNWPETFDLSLFCKPRPIPGIITAEFDRQAALMSRLRSNRMPGLGDDSSLANFYGSDYDTSPEGMSFTVFFFAYSAAIGREWQVYQQVRKEMGIGEDCNQEQVDMAQETELDYVVVEDDVVLPSSFVSKMAAMHCDSCHQVADMICGGSSNPCPNYATEINSHTQVAVETISHLTPAPSHESELLASTSLLDEETGFAEYEEAHDVAVAQLDLAFDVLGNMPLRGLLADPDVFKSLMEACGRCGDTHRALELIEMMKSEGLVADKDVLSGFMKAFSNDNDGSSLQETNSDRPKNSDAYYNQLEKSLPVTSILPHRDDDDEEEESDDEDTRSEGSLSQSDSVGSHAQQILGWFSTSEKPTRKAKRKRRKKKRKSIISAREAETDIVSKQIVLGTSLLDYLYPDLLIDTSCDTCPHCSRVMSGGDIVAGWLPGEFQDFMTKCGKCKHRFVPHFVVSCSSPTFVGSQGPGTPLFCEFLSPWVLRKELNHIKNGIESLLNPEWRSGTGIEATLWWNLVNMFLRYRLPLSFLLQGSFQNQLIHPSPQD